MSNYKWSSPQEMNNHKEFILFHKLLQLNPELYVCLESRTLESSKSVSAAILSHLDTATNILILNVDLSWLAKLKMSKINPIIGASSEQLVSPNLIIKAGKEIDELHYATAAQILLTDVKGVTTHITFPWTREDYWMLSQAQRWIFVSMENLLDDSKETFHWGYGDFDSLEAYNKFLYGNLNLGEEVD